MATRSTARFTLARNWVTVCSGARSSTRASTTAVVSGVNERVASTSSVACRCVICPGPEQVQGGGQAADEVGGDGHLPAHPTRRHPHRRRDHVPGEPVLRRIPRIQRGEQFGFPGLQQGDMALHRDQGVDLPVHLQHGRGQHIQDLEAARRTGPVGPGRRRCRSGTPTPRPGSVVHPPGRSRRTRASEPPHHRGCRPRHRPHRCSAVNASSQTRASKNAVRGAGHIS